MFGATRRRVTTKWVAWHCSRRPRNGTCSLSQMLVPRAVSSPSLSGDDDLSIHTPTGSRGLRLLDHTRPVAPLLLSPELS